MEEGDEVTMVCDFEELTIDFKLNGKPLRGFTKFVLPASIRSEELFVVTSLSRSKVTLIHWEHRYPPQQKA